MTKKSLYTIPNDGKIPGSAEDGENSYPSELQETTSNRVAVFLEFGGGDVRTSDSNLF